MNDDDIKTLLAERDELKVENKRQRQALSLALAAAGDALEDYKKNGAAAVRFAPSSAHWSNELRRLFGSDARDGIDRLEERLRAAEQDAARYRWLRKGESDDVAVVRGLGAMDYGMNAIVYTYWKSLDGDDLDSAIDEAMKKGGEA